MSRLKLIIITLSVSLSFFSCGKDQSTRTNITGEYTLPPVDTGDAITGDWIIQRELADPQSLNPITLQDATGREFSYHMFERLMWAADRTSYDLIPWLADTVEISEDYLTYTFKLKKNVVFSNGKPLTGEDVIFTFKAALNPLVDAAQLRNTIEMVKSVELAGGDRYTVKFNLSRKYFRALESIADIQIMSKEVIDAEGLTDKYTWDECTDINTANKNPAMKKFADFFNSEDINRSPKYLIGSGPYIFEKWETGQFVYFRRNLN
ncbi:MAG: ABC transporter substrate-binding protein, partial [Ignavibacteria bacterium]